LKNSRKKNNPLTPFNKGEYVQLKYMIFKIVRFTIIFLIQFTSFQVLLSISFAQSNQDSNFTYSHGAIIRGDSTKKEIALVFTGDSYADGAEHITKVLNETNVKASFFFTGNFYRNENFKSAIEKLRLDGHYLGVHSDKHLLYCAWENRDSTLVTKEEFINDLFNNYVEIERFGLSFKGAHYFLPPYEWYNDTISRWTKEFGLTLINFTPGTISHTDYTTPDMKNYKTSEEIHNSILNYENSHKNGLNGFILLVHFGTAPERKDKYYFYLQDLITVLKSRGYSFKRIDKLL
jgi:peptidoglycan/xylan/chitin deacetylase (PgdA/CDA1 family)